MRSVSFQPEFEIGALRSRCTSSWQIAPPQGGTINSTDARVTLQLVLAKAEARGLKPEHLAWPSVAAAVALLAATDLPRLEARARCGFSHRCVHAALTNQQQASI